MTDLRAAGWRRLTVPGRGVRYTRWLGVEADGRQRWLEVHRVGRGRWRWSVELGGTAQADAQESASGYAATKAAAQDAAATAAPGESR